MSANNDLNFAVDERKLTSHAGFASRAVTSKFLATRDFCGDVAISDKVGP